MNQKHSYSADYLESFARVSFQWDHNYCSKLIQITDSNNNSQQRDTVVKGKNFNQIYTLGGINGTTTITYTSSGGLFTGFGF